MGDSHYTLATQYFQVLGALRESQKQLADAMLSRENGQPVRVDITRCVHACNHNCILLTAITEQLRAAQTLEAVPTPLVIAA